MNYFNIDQESRDEESPRQTPDHEFFCAKAFLQKTSTLTGDNLYDHLSEVLCKILVERPDNVVDFFEEFSRKIKVLRFKPLADNLHDVYEPPSEFALASKMMPLLQSLTEKNGPENDVADISNLLEAFLHFELAGLGLPRMEMYTIMMSMRELVQKENISTIRFWGKIFGRVANYVILEAELKPKCNDEKEKIKKVLEGRQEQEAMIPQQKTSCFGVNKKVYYVNTGIGQPWIRLPYATTNQVRRARQIYASFSGNLDQKIETYPEFPGLEKNYLRAQIARISAGTQISPQGYYTFESDPEEMLKNLDYVPLVLEKLLDNSMAFWVHTAPYLLPEGYTACCKIKTQKNELQDEIEDDPCLLRPCSKDVFLTTTPAWSVRSSGLMSELAVAVASSNVWPGAYCIANQKDFFGNVYFGNGLKCLQDNFSPVPLPPVQSDYRTG